MDLSKQMNTGLRRNITHYTVTPYATPNPDNHKSTMVRRGDDLVSKSDGGGVVFLFLLLHRIPFYRFGIILKQASFEKDRKKPPQ